MQPQEHTDKLDESLQKYSEYLSDANLKFLEDFALQKLIQNHKITVSLAGKSKAGKSSTCNELICAKPRLSRNKKQKKGLFASGVNQMTSLPIIYTYDQKINQSQITWDLINSEKLMRQQKISDTKKISFNTFKQLQQQHQKHRKNVQKTMEQKKKLQEQSSQQLDYTQLQKLNAQINQLKKKSILVKGSYKLLKGDNQQKLNKYVLVCDTVGSNDRVIQQSKQKSEEKLKELEVQSKQKSEEKLKELEVQSKQKSEEKPKSKFENPFNNYIICFDLASGFNTDCKQQLQQVYKICPSPENVTISLNLVKYLQAPSTQETQGDQDDEDDQDDQNDQDDEDYDGFVNIDQFLEQFLYRIPQTLLDIFAQQGYVSKTTKYFKKGLNYVGLCSLKKEQYLKRIKNRIQEFQTILKQYGDKQNLFKSIKANKKIPERLLGSYPFGLIRFSGKDFMHGYQKDLIVKSVYEMADEVFRQKIKENIKNSLQKIWYKMKQETGSRIKQIIQGLQNKIKLKDLPAEKIQKLIQFNKMYIQPVREIIRKILTGTSQKKRNLDLETSKKMDKWIRQHKNPKEKNWYILNTTLKEDYSKQISQILKQNVEKTCKIYKDLEIQFKNSQELKEKTADINNIIKQQENKLVQNKMKEVVKEKIQNTVAHSLQSICAKELKTQNNLMKQIKQQANNEKLKLQIPDIDVEGILKNTATAIIGILSPALGIIISAGRIIMIAFTSAEALIFAVPLAISSFIYFPIKSYLQRNSDKQMIARWDNYLAFFGTIRQKMRKNSKKKVPTIESHEISDIIKLMEAEKQLKQLIRLLQQKLREFNKQCSQFENNEMKS